jgi:RHS repeat-associated protein
VTNGASDDVHDLLQSGTHAGPVYDIVQVPSNSDLIYQLTWRDSRVVWTFSEPLNKIVQNGLPLIESYSLPLTSITNSLGQSLYITGTTGGITKIQSGASWLAITPDGLTDNFGREVVYSAGANGTYSVSTVAPVGASNPQVRRSYGYTMFGQHVVSGMMGFLMNAHLELTSVSSPVTGNPSTSSTATISYDDNGVGEVLSTTDSENNTTAYSYGSGTTVQRYGFNHLTSQYTVTSEMGPFGAQITAFTDAAGNSVYYGYDGTHLNPTSITHRDKLTDTFVYDQHNHLTSHTDTMGVTTSFTWDYSAFAGGRLIAVSVPNLYSAAIQYSEPSGLVVNVTVTPSSGSPRSASFAYDSVGDVYWEAVSGNNAASQMITSANYALDVNNQPIFGEPLSITDNLGHVTSYTYDSLGDVTSVTDPLGNKSTYQYDLIGEMTSATNPPTGATGSSGSTSAYTYAYTGGPLVQVQALDESGNVTQAATATYGSEGELVSVAGNTNDAVYYGYDSSYRLSMVKQANNAYTYYSYDTLGDLSSITNSDNKTYNFPFYDPEQRLLQRVDPNGTATNYTYKGPGNALSAIAYTPGPNVSATAGASFNYDSFGRISSVAVGLGSESYTYDGLSNVTSVTRTYSHMPPVTFGYTYNPDGSVASMTNPAGAWNYSYDGIGRFVQLVSPGGTTSATYQNNDWPATRTNPMGTTTTYAFNPVGALTSLTNQLSPSLGGGPLSSFGSIQYDGVFRPKSLTAAVPETPTFGGSTGFVYDSKDRLSSESSTRGGSYGNNVTFDAIGNPTAINGNALTYSPTGTTITNTGFAYDNNGNPTTYKGNTLTFDTENRMTGYGTAMTAAYRSDGLRAWKKTAAGITYYYYDLSGNPVMETDGTGALTAINVFGPGGLSARLSGGAWTFYTFDPQGSVADRQYNNGNPVVGALYDAWGNEKSGPVTGDPYGYNAQSGYYLDRETGLYYCQNRYYDPSLGRWLTPDPIGFGGGMNVYAYTGSNPVASTDSEGLDYFHDVGSVFKGYGEAILNVFSGMIQDAKDPISYIPFISDAKQVYDLVVGVASALCHVANTDDPEDFGQNALPLIVMAASDGEGAEAVGATEAVGETTEAEAAEATATESTPAVAPPNSGVYAMVDKLGIVRYIGRTMDFVRRAYEHSLDSRFDGMDFQILEKTSDPELQCIREQQLIEEYGGPTGRGPVPRPTQLMNKINAISTRNPLYAKVHP